MMRNIRYMVLGFVVLLTACSSAKYPFLAAQVCLPTPEDLSGFTDEMRSFASSHHMKFIDGSAETQRGLEAIGTTKIKADIAKSPVVDMSIEQTDIVIMMFGNLGLPPHQYLFSFFEGANPEDTHKFADTFVSKVTQRWHIERLPANTGAQGMKQCN